MHSRLIADLCAAGSPPKLARKPVPLQPIQWGKRDPSLAAGVLHSLARTTPPHAIPFNTVLNRRLREFLRGHGFAR